MKSGASRMKNEGVMTVLVGETNMIKRGGANRVKEKNHKFFQTGSRNQVEIYFHVKSGASRMKTEGVMTILVGLTNLVT